MDTVTLVGRLLVSLAVVLGVMWLIARRMRKGGRTKDSRLIDVLGRQQLGRNSAVAVVRVGDQALVIGVTDTQVSVLGQTDLVAAQAMVASNETPKRLPTRAGHRVPLTVPSAVPSAVQSAQSVPFVPVAGVGAAADSTEPLPPRNALAGSALSPQTWRVALESLREMTSRST